MTNESTLHDLKEALALSRKITRSIEIALVEITGRVVTKEDYLTEFNTPDPAEDGMEPVEEEEVDHDAQEAYNNGYELGYELGYKEGLEKGRTEGGEKVAKAEEAPRPTHLGVPRLPEDMLKLGEAEFAIFGIPLAPSYTLEPEFVEVRSQATERYTGIPIARFTALVIDGKWEVSRGGTLEKSNL